MKKAKLLFVGGILFILGTTLAASAQSGDDKPNLENGTVEEQFDFVLDKSHTYEEYRVIKSYMFNKLRKQVKDTMKLVRSTMQEYQATISERDQIIDTLSSQLSETQIALETAIREKNSLSFLGIRMSKGSYNSVVWLLIAGLAGTLAFILLLYRRSHRVIRQARFDLEQLKEEFEKHRRRALEREEQVARRYHDELNKYKSKVVKQR